MKLMIEQCSVISISALQKAVRNLIRKDQPFANEEETFRYTEEEFNKFHVNDQTFEYTYQKNQLGGYRWFFVCGKCKGRALKLFLPPEAFKEYEHMYYCKKCHKLLNESVLKAGSGLYRKVIRPLRRLREIEVKLEKGHLQEKKVEELLNEYDILEQEMKDCPEYRLYAFRKKRGMKIL